MFLALISGKKIKLSFQGNIRVFCRIRPLLGEEVNKAPGGEIKHIDLHDEKSMSLIRSVGKAIYFKKKPSFHNR